MAALTGDMKRLELRGPDELAIKVKSGVTIYNGALCKFDSVTGPITPAGTAGTDALAGWHFADTRTSETKQTNGEAEITPGPFIWAKRAVAGLTGDDTDLGKTVYATSDNDLTVTQPGAGSRQPVGKVVRSRSATLCDVYMENVMGRVGS